MSITKHNAPDHIFEPDTPPEMPANRSSLRFERSRHWNPPSTLNLGPGLSNRSQEAKAERARLRVVIKYIKARSFHQECLARSKAFPDLDTTRLAADLKSFWRQQWRSAHEWISPFPLR